MKTSAVFLIFAVLNLREETHGHRNVYCYMHSGNGTGLIKICQNRNKENPCCKNFDKVRIRAYRAESENCSNSQNSQKCQRSCCQKVEYNKDEEQDIGNKKFIRRVFTSTRCFNNLPVHVDHEITKSLSLANDFDQGPYFIVVQYDCQENSVNMTLAVTIPVSVSVVIIAIAVTLAFVHRNRLRQKRKIVSTLNYNILSKEILKSVISNKDSVVNSSGNISSRSCNDIEVKPNENGDYDEIPADRYSGRLTAAHVNPYDVINQKTLPVLNDPNYGYPSDATRADIDDALYDVTGTIAHVWVHQASDYNHVKYKNEAGHSRKFATGTDVPTSSCELEGVTSVDETEPREIQPESIETKPDANNDQASVGPPGFLVKN